MMKANAVIPDLAAQVADIPEATIVSRTVYKDSGLRAILFGFAPGETLSEHTSAFPAVLHFLEGEAALTLGEEALEAKPGTWVYMPAHLPHSVQAHTAVKMLLLMMVT